jgi:biotin synthase-like enzyme
MENIRDLDKISTDYDTWSNNKCDRPKVTVDYFNNNVETTNNNFSKMVSLIEKLEDRIKILEDKIKILENK